MRASITVNETSNSHAATFSIFFDPGKEEKIVESWKSRDRFERARVNIESLAIGRLVITKAEDGRVVSFAAGAPKVSMSGDKLPAWMVKNRVKISGVLALKFIESRQCFVVDLPESMVLPKYRDKIPEPLTVKKPKVKEPTAPVAPAPTEITEPSRSYPELRKALQDCKELHHENLLEMKSLISDMNALGHNVSMKFSPSGKLVVGVTVTEEL